MIPKNWKDYIPWLLTLALIAALMTFGLWPKDAPVPPPPVPIFEPSEAPDGWTPKPEEVQAVAATLEIKVFADTPAGQADDPLPDHVYLWQAYTKLFARPPPSKDQGALGSCVSFGTNNAVERTLAVQIALKGEAFDFHHIAEEVTYGGSRVQIGGGKLGRSDGSVGAWAAQFVQKWGVVARDKYTKYDLSAYSVATCRTFGNSGVPVDLQDVARKNPVKAITQVKSWIEAKKALASGYGIAVCSDVGFESPRDANGVKKARGSWGHCMCLDGYHIEGGKEYGHIENSWGSRPAEGPVGWGSPPDSGFWAESATVNKMLAQNDSWAFSGVVGFPKRKIDIDWFVLAPAPMRDNLALRPRANDREPMFASKL